MLRKLSLKSEFAGFLVAGGLAALANVGSRMLFSQLASYPVAIVLAYLVGMVTAFLLMRGHVFGTRSGRLGSEITAFVVVNALAVLQTLVVSLVLAYYVLPWIGIQQDAETVAHVVGVVVPVITSYYGHKYWTFRSA
jgi:putative flippase GtrA